MSKKIKYIESMSELGAGTRGASLGGQALRVAARNQEDRFFQHVDPIKIDGRNSLLDHADRFPAAHRIDGIVKVWKDHSAAVKQTLEQGSFPVVIAADHANGGATIAGLKAAYPDKRIGVIWLDAHLDLNTPYTSGSGNVHGMPLAAAIADDNTEYALREVKDETRAYWEELKNTAGISPMVMGHDLAFLGIRDPDDPELKLVQRYQMAVISIEESQQLGMRQSALKLLEQVSECDLIHLSFDVDVLDTSVSVGTGTPVKGGLSVSEASTLINEILMNEKVGCFEIVEINPTLDTKNAMANSAFEILKSAVQTIEKRP